MRNLGGRYFISTVTVVTQSNSIQVDPTSPAETAQAIYMQYVEHARAALQDTGGSLTLALGLDDQTDREIFAALKTVARTNFTEFNVTAEEFATSGELVFSRRV